MDVRRKVPSHARRTLWVSKQFLPVSSSMNLREYWFYEHIFEPTECGVEEHREVKKWSLNRTGSVSRDCSVYRAERNNVPILHTDVHNGSVRTTRIRRRKIIYKRIHTHVHLIYSTYRLWYIYTRLLSGTYYRCPVVFLRILNNSIMSVETRG